MFQVGAYFQYDNPAQFSRKKRNLSINIECLVCQWCSFSKISPSASSPDLNAHKKHISVSKPDVQQYQQCISGPWHPTDSWFVRCFKRSASQKERYIQYPELRNNWVKKHFFSRRWLEWLCHLLFFESFFELLVTLNLFGLIHCFSLILSWELSVQGGRAKKRSLRYRHKKQIVWLGFNQDVETYYVMQWVEVEIDDIG